MMKDLKKKKKKQANLQFTIQQKYPPKMKTKIQIFSIKNK